MTTTARRHRQKDRETDRQTGERTTCRGNTVQRVTSRGKKYFIQHCLYVSDHCTRYTDTVLVQVQRCTVILQ